jgi:hypothetical protein
MGLVMTSIPGDPATTATPAAYATALRWPLPGLLAWGTAWGAFVLLRGGPWPAWVAFAAAAAVPLAWLAGVRGLVRQAIVVGGFPLSALALGVAGTLPGWVWLLALAALLLLYPLRAWLDAPLYPTAPDALEGLRARLDLPPVPHLLDAGCGLGHGLAALRQEWPQARLAGIERSAVLACVARWRARPAQVRWGDMWRCSWAGHNLVYLFQRPESMPRAWTKAQAELAPGAWLVSLEFPVPGREADVTVGPAGRRIVWAYRIGGLLPADRRRRTRPAQSRRRRADKRR